MAEFALENRHFNVPKLFVGIVRHTDLYGTRIYLQHCVEFVNELNVFYFLRLLEFLRNFYFYAFWC